MPSFMIWQEDEKKCGKRTVNQAYLRKIHCKKIRINLTNHSKVRRKVLANCKHLTEEYV